MTALTGCIRVSPSWSKSLAALLRTARDVKIAPLSGAAERTLTARTVLRRSLKRKGRGRRTGEKSFAKMEPSPASNPSKSQFTVRTPHFSRAGVPQAQSSGALRGYGCGVRVLPRFHAPGLDPDRRDIGRPLHSLPRGGAPRGFLSSAASTI